jgi:phenylalanyl-tRNA synthetase beta chain
MLISLSWLKKYIDIPVDTGTLVSDLTMLGLNVERTISSGFDSASVVVGHVLEAERHPNADRLTVCRVDVGGDEALEIVCGAPNVTAGQYVPVALHGARLPNGMKIKKSKIRGVKSNGMICSEIELGLGEDASGIIVLDGEHKPGTKAAEVLGAGDTVLDIEVTPNRPDQLSHIGVAREVSALYSTPVRYPYQTVEPGAGSDDLAVGIENREDCYRYVARIVSGVRVGQSPEWLRSALEALGINSINSVVDIANYVMIETGQPLHVFDINRLGGLDVGVRRAHGGEKLRALDDVEYDLKDDYLIITESDRPVAVAGVIGGLDSGVTETTTDVLIESAAFAPRVVRKTRKSMNINTEASYRFERGSDREVCRLASDRVAELIMELAGGEAGAIVDAFPTPAKSRAVSIRKSNTRRILGVSIETDEIADLLSRLHFETLDTAAEEVLVRVPSFRADVLEEMDLIEEVARLYGYDRIGKGWSFRSSTFARVDEYESFCESIGDFLAARGYSELLTSSFTSGSEIELMGWENTDPRRQLIRIRNPLTSNQTYLRTTPLPGVVEAIRRNFGHGERDIAVFTLGTVFLPAGGPGAADGTAGLPQERLLLALARTRPEGQDFWSQSKKTTDLFDIKREIEAIAATQGIDIDGRLAYSFDSTAGRFAYKNRKATVAEGGILPARLAAANDIDQPVWYCVVDMSALYKVRPSRQRFSSLSEYPASKRDLSLVTPGDVTYDQVKKCLVKYSGPLLESVQVFDVYRGESLPDGATAFGVRVIFRSADRTLRDEEIDEVLEKVLQKLHNEHGVTLRD